MSNIPTELIRGLSEEDKKKYELAWRNSTYVLDKIKELIKTKIDLNILDEQSDYSSNNWTVLRADKNGRVQAYKEILKYFP